MHAFSVRDAQEAKNATWNKVKRLEENVENMRLVSVSYSPCGRKRSGLTNAPELCSQDSVGKKVVPTKI